MTLWAPDGPYLQSSWFNLPWRPAKCDSGAVQRWPGDFKKEESSLLLPFPGVGVGGRAARVSHGGVEKLENWRNGVRSKDGLSVGLLPSSPRGRVCTVMGGVLNREASLWFVFFGGFFLFCFAFWS